MSNVALRSRFAAVSAAMRKQMEVLLDIEADYELLLDELKEIRYPVASLPAEILSEIFLSLDREPEGVLYACNSPLLLCRICRTWRQIALRTPGLWSTFNVVAESETQKANVAGMAEVWLARAGRLPISLAIQGKLSDVKSVDALLATLKHHSSKVRSLILQTDADEISFLDQHIAPLPALEEISIHPSNSGGGPLQPQTLSLIQSSPRLRTITLKGATLSLLPVPFSTFRLPVAPQVTKLQLWGCTFEEAHQALSALPNLTEATFSLDHGWPQNGAQPALNRLTHPNIQSLNVLVFAYFDPESDWVRLFEFLDLPKLENFRCTGTNESDLASPLLAAFLERSPLLHSIQLGSTGLSAPQPAMFLPPQRTETNQTRPPIEARPRRVARRVRYRRQLFALHGKFPVVGI
ncbi:F-box domain-containing protein [Mycena kentingensis (nom. inval.)]|nr:F-box domain-containing protein [Mycena kentingensis (nom. inval.)]